MVQTTSAHDPGWQIPTQAYIIAAPDPVGVGQTAHIYMWLTAVFGAAGGTTASVGTNASTASAALLGNNYRFHNYKLTITAPDGTNSTQTFEQSQTQHHHNSSNTFPAKSELTLSHLISQDKTTLNTHTMKALL